jgi:hypothetical protein
MADETNTANLKAILSLIVKLDDSSFKKAKEELKSIQGEPVRSSPKETKSGASPVRTNLADRIPTISSNAVKSGSVSSTIPSKSLGDNTPMLSKKDKKEDSSFKSTNLADKLPTVSSNANKEKSSTQSKSLGDNIPMVSKRDKLEDSSFKKVKYDFKSLQGDTARAPLVTPGPTPARTNLADKLPTVPSNVGKETSSTPSKSLGDNISIFSKNDKLEDSFFKKVKDDLKSIQGDTTRVPPVSHSPTPARTNLADKLPTVPSNANNEKSSTQSKSLEDSIRILSKNDKIEDSFFKKMKDDFKSVQDDIVRAFSVAPSPTPARTNLADKLPTVPSNVGKETSSTQSKSLEDSICIFSKNDKIEDSFFKKMKDDFKSVQDDIVRACSVSHSPTPARTNLADKSPTVPSNASKEKSFTQSKSLADNLPLISKKEDKEESKSSSMDLSKVTRMLGSGESGGTGALNAEKGMKGGAKAGVAGAALMVLEKLLALFQQLVQIAMDSSPLFQSMAKLFNTSMKLLFMPLGQMMARVLMPIVLKYLQKSVDTAQKYMNAPPSSAEEVMSNATKNMLSATGEVFGKVLTDILPPIFIGFLSGLVEAIKGLFGFGKDPVEAFNRKISEVTSNYDKAFSASGMKLVKGAEGFATALDQFGLVMYTANNVVGEAASSLATTFYHGSDIIVSGFTGAMEVVTYGTTDMINYLNDEFNVIAAGTATSLDTITERAWTTGQSLDLFSNVTDSAMFQMIDFQKPIPTVIDSLSALSLGFNTLAASIPLIIQEIMAAIRDETLDETGMKGPEKVNPNGDTGIWSVDNLWKSTADEYKKAAAINYDLNKDLYDKLGLDKTKGYTLWEFNGAYNIVDEQGSSVKAGIYNKETANLKSGLESLKSPMKLAGPLGWLADALGYLPTLWDTTFDTGVYTEGVSDLISSAINGASNSFGGSGKAGPTSGAGMFDPNEKSLRGGRNGLSDLPDTTTTNTTGGGSNIINSDIWAKIDENLNILKGINLDMPDFEKHEQYDPNSYEFTKFDESLINKDYINGVKSNGIDWDAVLSRIKTPNYAATASGLISNTTTGFANDFSGYYLDSTATGNFSRTLESSQPAYNTGMMGRIPRYELQESKKKQENINLNMSIYGDVLGINDIQKEVESMIDNYLATRRSGF